MVDRKIRSTWNVSGGKPDLREHNNTSVYCVVQRKMLWNSIKSLRRLCSEDNIKIKNVCWYQFFFLTKPCLPLILDPCYSSLRLRYFIIRFIFCKILNYRNNSFPDKRGRNVRFLKISYIILRLRRSWSCDAVATSCYFSSNRRSRQLPLLL